jgi:IS5 family transposase
MLVMSVKKVGEPGFADAMLAGRGVTTNVHLDRLSELVKWYRFEKLLEGVRDEASTGRPGYPALVLLKGLLLQSMYGLSDRELEEALVDRLSFRRFVGLSLEDDVPDHTVLNRFRTRLAQSGRLERLFTELERQLDKAGLILRRGTMLDATLIETSAASRPKGRKDVGDGADPEARFGYSSTKKGWTYGYKAHVGVDQGSGLIRRVVTTTANISDTSVADELICGDERAVLADKAYDTHARRARLKAGGTKSRISRRPHWTHPRLPPRLLRFNELVARRRAAVETTFATLKRRMSLGSIRYVGLQKATAQVTLAAMAFNLRRWVTMAAA